MRCLKYRAQNIQPTTIFVIPVEKKKRIRWKSRRQCGKRDAYMLVCVCTDPFTVQEHTQRVVSRKLCCNVKENISRVRILRHLYEEVPYPSPGQTSIRAFERHNSRCRVHGDAIIAGRILRNPPCGNCRRQITFSQFCETTRNSQCPRCRNKWKLSKLRQPRIVLSRLRKYDHVWRMRAPSWKDVGLIPRIINRARWIFKFRTTLAVDTRERFLSRVPPRISLRARQYCFAESREPERACARFLIRARRNYPTKFKTGVRTLLGGIVETAGRLLPRARSLAREAVETSKRGG